MPYIDLKTVEARLAEIEEEKTFLDALRSILLDPRVAKLSSSNGSTTLNAALVPQQSPIGKPVYGEQKKAVIDVLPAREPGMSTKEIAAAMQAKGYVFAAKYPEIAVNETLVSLGNQVRVVGKRGLAKLWATNQEASEEAS